MCVCCSAFDASCSLARRRLPLSYTRSSLHTLQLPSAASAHAQCTVQFQFSMWQLVEVDTMKQTIELHGWSRHYWRDLRLVYMYSTCAQYVYMMHEPVRSQRCLIWGS